MENKVLIPIPAELLSAIFSYLGTKPANEVEEFRYGIRQADAEYARARQAESAASEPVPPEECMPG